MAVFDGIKKARTGGTLVKVQIAPGVFQKLYLEDAIAAGYAVPQINRRDEEEMQETPLPPRQEPVVGEGEEEPAVRRPKRRPQGRNKMIATPEEDK